MEFSEVLKNERKKKGLSLRSLAKNSDMSQAYLSQLENGSSKNPAIEKILAISYVLDAQGYDHVFKKLIDASNIKVDNPDEVFKQYVESKQTILDFYSFTNKIRVNRKDKSMIELDVPSFDIEWLLSQDIFHLFLGTIPNDYILVDKNKKQPTVFVLNDMERIQLRDIIKNKKEEFINERMKEEEEYDKAELEKTAKKYYLIDSLLKNEINDEETLRLELFNVSNEYQNVITQEYIETIFKAANNNNGKMLIDLLNTTDLKKFKKKYLGTD